MPQNNNAARKPGSRSAGHRGYRPDDTQTAGRPKKKRWNADDRAARGGRVADDGRPNWMPREKGSADSRYQGAPKGPRESRDYRDRPVRDDSRYQGSSKGPRESRDYRDRPVRNTDAPRSRFDKLSDRDSRSDRPRNERNDRPRYNRDERPRYDRDERPRRDRDDRPQRDSQFYPEKAPQLVDDVVLERLEATAIEAGSVDGLGFGDLGLGTNIVRALSELGAEQPFPIQAATIPEVLAGRDVLGRGRTGSGKTIAFGAPLVEKLMENQGGRKRSMGRAPRALILAPTRELALQIDRTVQPIARSVGLFTTQIYGGVPQGRQVGALQRGVDIIIGTPGRIEDLHRQGRLDLSQVTVTVLDEADHMCDLGFLEPVQRILRLTAEGGQRLLFSATLDKGVATLVDEFLTEPAVHEVAGEDQASSTIDHRLLLIDQREKRQIITELAGGEGKTLVFTRTRAFAEELADMLDDAGIPSTSLHGDLNQSRRTRNLSLLTNGRVKVLVATDVAARGIHVDDVSLVIQADAPEEYKTYLHRAGRTGRAGKRGTVVTLVPRNRRRRMEELLQRAEITAEQEFVAPGDALLGELAASIAE